MSLSVIILAAGQGMRMKSKTSKVLHELGGISMLQRVVNTAQSLGADRIHVVYGHQGDQIKKVCADLPVNCVEQKQQLGTAHAVQQALPYCEPDDQVLVLCADVPLIQSSTLRDFISKVDENNIGLLTAFFKDPTGFGRIIRNVQNRVTAIVEHKDASEDERKIHEINTGIMCAHVKLFNHYLSQIKNHNAQNEFYLTDLIKFGVADGRSIADKVAEVAEEVYGINDRLQLAQLERYYQKQQAKQLCLQGVTVMDPDRLDIRGELIIDADVCLDVNVIIEGKVKIGAGSKIGANVILKNLTLGENVEILPNSILEDCVIENDCSIGPFARIRPGTQLKAHARIGNFVEVKNSEIGPNSKVNHLSYVGDATLGRDVNIGAGTITCNYDGANKHRTTIEDEVFIGSNSALVAPVTIQKGATIGAGSVITKNAPAQELTLTRVKQLSFASWQRPTKAKKS